MGNCSRNMSRCCWVAYTSVRRHRGSESAGLSLFLILCFHFEPVRHTEALWVIYTDQLYSHAADWTAEGSKTKVIVFLMWAIITNITHYHLVGNSAHSIFQNLSLLWAKTLISSFRLRRSRTNRLQDSLYNSAMALINANSWQQPIRSKLTWLAAFMDNKNNTNNVQ